MRVALFVVSAIAMLAALHLDPWGRSNMAAALFLAGAAGWIVAVTA